MAVTNLQTGFSYKLVTNDAGVFSAQMLPPGDYEFVVTAPGMAPTSKR